MSASVAQIEANRANAQSSTGPRTPEGKAASSRNAATHGILSKVLPSEREEYHELLEAIRDDLVPAGIMQELLVEEIALAYIRLRRIHSHEMKNMEPRTEVDPATGDRTTTGHYYSPMDYYGFKHAHNLLRYESACQRTINRCLARLKELKGDKVWNPESLPPPLAPAPPAPPAPPARPPNGFVSQNHESPREHEPPANSPHSHPGSTMPADPGPNGFVSQKSYAPHGQPRPHQRPQGR